MWFGECKRKISYKYIHSNYEVIASDRDSFVPSVRTRSRAIPPRSETEAGHSFTTSPPQMASVSGQIAPTTHNHALFTNGDALTVESPTFNMNPSVTSPLSVPVPVQARHAGEGLNQSRPWGSPGAFSAMFGTIIHPIMTQYAELDFSHKTASIKARVSLLSGGRLALEIILEHLPSPE